MLNMRTLRVLSKGQIVIPAQLRHRYGIKPGSSVEIRDAGDHLEIYLLPDDPLAAFRGSLKGSESLADALIQEHRQEANRDDT